MVHDISVSSVRQLEKNCFRQVCDKPCAHRIIQAEWSPIHDLIAVITSNGEVRLHRMYWQKVWMLPAKDAHATSLVWKYNGRLLAIGYDNGDVNLLEIEKSVVVHSMSCTSHITSLSWVAKKKEKHDIIYEDCSEKCLPEINKEEFKKELQYTNLNIGDDDQYSILIVGNDQGELFLFIEGVYLILRISVNDELGLSTGSIICSHLALETGIISVICKGELNNSMENKSNYYLHQLDSKLLSHRGLELSHLSMKFIKMRNTLQLCGSVLKQMSDASEDICVKINSKLEKLEQLLPAENSVSSEFTIAYATGKISTELATFLREYLTAKGLKQIAQNIQSAYVSLRCDVGELDTITQQLLSHILELRGMVSWHEKFGVLGLSLDDVQQCVMFISQFRMKTQELLDVISSDMTNFSVFFSWLKNILCQAGGDFTQVLPFQLSNEDYDIMLDFLEHRLLKVEKQSGSSYDLERVSQYFRQGFLDIKGSATENAWNNYIKNNEILNVSHLIMKPAVNDTLQGLYEQVQKHYNVVFNSVLSCMSNSLSTILSSNLYHEHDEHEEDCQSHFSFMKNENKLLLLNLACTCSSDHMFMFEILNENHLNIIGLQLNISLQVDQADLDQSFHCKCTIRDVKFYNQEFLTVLAEEDEKSNDHLITLLAQVPLNKLLCGAKKTVAPDILKPILGDSSDIQWINLNNHFNELRRMEAFRGKQLYVNGNSRKVSSIVSMSGRRIRIFDMTAYDDEFDDTKMDDSKTENDSKNESNLKHGHDLESKKDLENEDGLENESELKIEELEEGNNSASRDSILSI